MKKKLSIVKAIEEQHVQQLLALFPKGGKKKKRDVNFKKRLNSFKKKRFRIL